MNHDQAEFTPSMEGFFSFKKSGNVIHLINNNNNAHIYIW